MPILRIHYATWPGEHVVIRSPRQPDTPLMWTGGGWWTGTVTESLTRYRYAVVDDETTHSDREEAGAWRELPSGLSDDAVVLDSWRRPSPIDRAVASSAFVKVLRARPSRSRRAATGSSETPQITFRLFAPDVEPDQRIVVVGDRPELGSWDPVDGIALDDSEFPWWTATVAMDPASGSAEYKYVVVGGDPGGVSWEAGSNRSLHPVGDTTSLVVVDQELRRRPVPWRGAGVAVPLFSVRSQNDHGVGRFTDLAPLADWAASAGLSLVQLLPINDTTLHHDQRDSYPYRPISSMALHPMYIDTDAIDPITDPEILSGRAELLGERVDHEGLMAQIGAELRHLWVRHRDGLADDADFARFRRDEADWLDSYAAFCVLRDRLGPDPAGWGRFATYDSSELRRAEADDEELGDELQFHRWVQWHLHRQLANAVDHARERGVIIKGDLPIGVAPISVDVWEAPELFDTSTAAGAPPDDFAVDGQNWGFPTYRWETMARDGFAWWRRRLRSMAVSFDAYRVDHVLGFFRIWQIPTREVVGTLGRFEPCRPLTTDEIARALGWFDRDRLTRPRISRDRLAALFGDDDVDAAIERYLVPAGDDLWTSADGWATQRDVLDQLGPDHPDTCALFEVLGSVLAVEALDETGAPRGLAPRISVETTDSYRQLSADEQRAWSSLATQFFHHRHANQWEARGRLTLPALLDASDLLICAEDLGMVPDFVPDLIRELGLLSLEIQRMPKRPGADIGEPADAPYLAVVATGTHDMATLRGWWADEPDQVAALWQRSGHAAGHDERAPGSASPEAVEIVLEDHLASTAMWAIFPIQDLLALDADLVSENPDDERINVPADPDHVWDYRMTTTIGDLATHPVTSAIGDLVARSGRRSPRPLD